MVDPGGDMRGADVRALPFWSGLVYVLVLLLGLVLGVERNSMNRPVVTQEGGLLRALAGLSLLALSAGLAAFVRRIEQLDEAPHQSTSGMSSLVLAAGSAAATLELAAGALFMRERSTTELGLVLSCASSMALAAVPLVAAFPLLRVGRQASASALLGFVAAPALFARGAGGLYQTRVAYGLAPLIEPLRGVSMVLGGLFALWVIVTILVVRKTELHALG
jgi:hypothetical protein